VRAVLLDTGPVVGLLHEGDAHQAATIAAIKASVGQGRALATTWEVVAEAYTLIRTRLSAHRLPAPALTVLKWARESGVLVIPADEEDQVRTAAILGTHGDLPLSYVDALFLALGERHRVEEVITVDGRLQAVRLNHNPVVTVV
jgi:predicted nucleic acid-binding protein